MTRMPVKNQSTSVVSVGYEPTLTTLEIEFNNKRVYRYFGVETAAVFYELVEAESPGSYFAKNIKPKYPRYMEVTDLTPDLDTNE